MGQFDAFTDTKILRDYGGNPRVITATRTDGR
jgi:hypothetical protein